MMIRMLKQEESYCCCNGCGECEIDSHLLSNCCASPVFIWDNNLGVLVETSSQDVES